MQNYLSKDTQDKDTLWMLDTQQLVCIADRISKYRPSDYSFSQGDTQAKLRTLLSRAQELICAVEDML